jgi:hypothetical protein
MTNPSKPKLGALWYITDMTGRFCIATRGTKNSLSIDGTELEVGAAFPLAEVPNLLGMLDVFRNFEINFRKEEDFCFSD